MDQHESRNFRLFFLGKLRIVQICFFKTEDLDLRLKPAQKCRVGNPFSFKKLDNYNTFAGSRHHYCFPQRCR